MPRITSFSRGPVAAAQILLLISSAFKEFRGRKSKAIGNTANCQVAPADLTASLLNAARDTTYLSVVDRDGNIVSLIQSNSAAFRTGLVPPRLGFVLQNRGSGFSLDAKHPNALAPRKRPFHTIIPGLLTKGDVTIGFGIMGGLNQPQAHAQFVSNIVGFRYESSGSARRCALY